MCRDDLEVPPWHETSVRSTEEAIMPGWCACRMPEFRIERAKVPERDCSRRALECSISFEQPLSERDRGRNLDPSKQTLSQYLDRWLEVGAKSRLRAESFRDQGLLRRYVRPHPGAKTLATVSEFDIQILYRDVLTGNRPLDSHCGKSSGSGGPA